MVAEARKRGFEVIDDNEADAIALLDYKLKEMTAEGAAEPPTPLTEIGEDDGATY